MPRSKKNLRRSWLLASVYKRLFLVLPFIGLMWWLYFWALG